MEEIKERLRQNKPLVMVAGGTVLLSALFSCFSCNKGDTDPLAAKSRPPAAEVRASAPVPDPIINTEHLDPHNPLDRVALKLEKEKAAAASIRARAAAEAQAETQSDEADPVKPEGDPQGMRCPEGSVPVGAPPPKGNLFWCAAKAAIGTGEKNGPYLKWDNDGNKRLEAYYVNGQPHGQMITYYPDEREEELKEFSNGVMNGRWIQWNRDGDKIAEGVFSNGKKNGKFTYWDRHGSLSSEGSYKNNLEWGTWTNYYPDGEMQSRISYRDGRKSGKAETFFQTGQLSSSGSYRDNKLDGEWIYYTEDGRVKVRGSYIEGRKNGPWLSYKPDGQLADTTNYDNGHAIRDRRGNARNARNTQSSGQPSSRGAWVEM